MTTSEKAIAIINSIVGVGPYEGESTGYSGYGGVSFLALSRSKPGVNGSNFNELPAEYGYSRATLGGRGSGYSSFNKMTTATYTANESDPNSGRVSSTNNVEIHFNKAKLAWDTIEYFGIYQGGTESGGGKLVYIGKLKSPLQIAEGEVAVIDKGALEIYTDLTAL